MLHKLSFAFLFAILTCGKITSAHDNVQDKCPAVKYPEGFDWKRFEGVWFEYSRSKDDYIEGLMVCVIRSFLTIQDDIGVSISGIIAHNETFSLAGTGKIMVPGRFYVNFNGNGQKRVGQILGTDYNSWAAFLSCEEGSNVHTTAVILTRERNPNPDTVKRATEVLKKNNISTTFLHKTRYNDCPN